MNETLQQQEIDSSDFYKKEKFYQFIFRKLPSLTFEQIFFFSIVVYVFVEAILKSWAYDSSVENILEEKIKFPNIPLEPEDDFDGKNKNAVVIINSNKDAVEASIPITTLISGFLASLLPASAPEIYQVPRPQVPSIVEDDELLQLPPNNFEGFTKLSDVFNSGSCKNLSKERRNQVLCERKIENIKDLKEHAKNEKKWYSLKETSNSSSYETCMTDLLEDLLLNKEQINCDVNNESNQVIVVRGKVNLVDELLGAAAGFSAFVGFVALATGFA